MVIVLCQLNTGYLSFWNLNYIKGGPKKMSPMFKCYFLTLYVDLWQNQGVFRIPHVLEIYLGIETSQFDEDWPKLRAKNWRHVESEIYMYIFKFQQ